MPFFLLLFIVMPIVEIAVLLRVGSAIGWLPTLAIVVLTAVIGTTMLRQQGLATLAKARERMGRGEMPASQMIEGLILMVGGALLLTPGFVTDAFGFACLIPPSRAAIASYIKKRGVMGAGVVINGQVHGGAAANEPGGPGPFRQAGPQAGQGVPPGNLNAGPGARAPRRPGDSEGEIIEGDYQRKD